MCGRLCCCCNYSSYSKRLEPLFRTGNQPSWTDASKFAPSTNLAPASDIPVLYLDEHKNLLIRPMVWGIEINTWTSDGKSPVLHNMRIETLLAPHYGSRHFESILPSRKCCAIVCDGFYEWNQKRPFFFYNANEYDTSIITPKWKENDWIEKGPPVMVLAGVYSSTVSEGKGSGTTWEENYSCAVISKDASSRTRHIHHRIPIMLETGEDIMAWLDREDKTIEQSLRTLNGVKNDNFSYYEVKDKVNNSRYQGPDCHLPLSCFPTDGKLDQWLSKSQTQDTRCSDRKQMDAEKPSHIKRKCSSSDIPSKKKSLITDWFKKTPPNT